MQTLLRALPDRTLILSIWGVLLILSLAPTMPALQPLIHWLPLTLSQAIWVLLALLLLMMFKQTRQNKLLQTQLIEQQANHQSQIKQLKRQHDCEDNTFKTLMQSDQIAYWEWDVKHNKARFSPQWKNLLGLPSDTNLNNLHDLQNRIHPKDQQAVQQRLLKMLSGEQRHFECTHRVRHEDGHYLWVHDKGQIFYNASGEIEKLSAIRLDVSEQKWIEAELELDATIIEHSSEGIAIADEQFKIIRCNLALSRVLGIEREHIHQETLPGLLRKLQPEAAERLIKDLKQHGSWRGELSLLDEAGNLKLASMVTVSKLFHETTQQTHYSLVQSDITDLKRTQKALDDLANIDSVTGLANRNKLYQSLENVIQERHPITLLFLDLDNFKPVNDTLGHDIGDQLLNAIGKVIQQELPENALAARVGGDEFVAFYPTPYLSTNEDASTQNLELIAQNITQKLSEPFKIQNHTIQVGSSIGIARFPEDADNRKTLLKAADTAMYEAKRNGKGHYREFCQLSQAELKLETPHR